MTGAVGQVLAWGVRAVPSGDHENHPQRGEGQDQLESSATAVANVSLWPLGS